MIAFAALTGPLPKAGVIAVSLLAAAVLVTRERRVRAAAMLGALVLAPVLLLAEIWHSPQLGAVHRHPLEAAVAVVVLVAVVALAAAGLVRRPGLVAPLAVFTLPFRVPIQAAGRTANLLVPLYFVVGAAVLALLWRDLRAPRAGEAERARSPAPPLPDATPLPDAPPLPDAARTRRPRRPPGGAATGAAAWVARFQAADLVTWAERMLALYIVLYGIQAAYSPGFEKALQNVVFFYVPFALLYRLLRDLRWTNELVRRCLQVTVVLALLFSVVGFYERATRTILLNPKVIAENNLHTYFTVNSFFFDPNLFGRYLALVMVLLAVMLIYDRPRREQSVVTVALVILWACLVLTLSRSSMGALLVGMGVLAALRWKPSRALVVAVVVVAAGAIAVAASPRTFGLNQGINGAASGRGGLVSGGLTMFAQRPVWGYGSGSFSTEYRAQHRHTPSTLSDSHTIPVTIAAEQGLLGEIVYIAFLAAAIGALVRGARGDPLRSAVAAAFVALTFHTFLYADFLEDPATWVLLAVGLALARAPATVPVVVADAAVSRPRGPAVARS